MRKIKIFLCLLSLLSVGAACATVHQIDRGRLAKPIMQLEPMPQQEGMRTEVHAIREGAAGGAGHSAGGGCGCN